MTTKEEILNDSKTHKNALQKYFFGVTQYLAKPLTKFKKHELNALYFLSIESPDELCKFLKCNFFQIEEMINHPKYTTHLIPKKRGGTRSILEPEAQLKRVQKHLNYFLQAYYLWIKPSQVHGFVVKPHYINAQCNIVENAKIHINKKNILNIDLKDFFPSITAQQVKNTFLSSYFNFSEQIATALTLLTTFQGKLPTGAPTSPVISNFICSKLDAELIEYSKKNHLYFSRYADDLTFSSNHEITLQNKLDIFNIIKHNHFEVNEKKVYLKSNYRKQTVTGLTVNEKINVDNKLLKKIRAMLHDLGSNGIYASAKKHFKKDQIHQQYETLFLNRLQGYINFVGQVRGENDPLYFKFKTSLNNHLKAITPKPVK